MPNSLQPAPHRRGSVPEAWTGPPSHTQSSAWVAQGLLHHGDRGRRQGLHASTGMRGYHETPGPDGSGKALHGFLPLIASPMWLVTVGGRVGPVPTPGGWVCAGDRVGGGARSVGPEWAQHRSQRRLGPRPERVRTRSASLPTGGGPGRVVTRACGSSSIIPQNLDTCRREFHVTAPGASRGGWGDAFTGPSGYGLRPAPSCLLYCGRSAGVMVTLLAWC